MGSRAAEIADKGAIQRDRPFKPERRARGDAAKHLVGTIVARLVAFETQRGLRVRARRSVDQETFCATVEAVVCDALHRHFTKPRGWIAVPISKRVLARKDRYRSVVMGKQLPDVLTRLASGYLKVLRLKKGKRGRLTTFRATRALIDAAEAAGVMLADVVRQTPREIILLRGPKPRPDKKGPLRKYEDTEQTLRYREQLTTINEALMRADLSVVGLPSVDASDRLLTRTFNDDCFKRGGRLNGAFWIGLDPERRLRAVRIDSEPVAELDFGQCGTRIAYGLAGVRLPEGDLYAVPRFDALPESATPEREPFLYFERDGVKRVTNAMIYAGKPLRRFPKHTRKHFRHESIDVVTGKIAARHHGIAHFFYSGVGLRTMWIESEVLIDVLTRSMQAGIVALPVHDAVLVKRAALEAVRSIMLTSFKRITGVEASVSISMEE
jgi:hypothetical protein